MAPWLLDPQHRPMLDDWLGPSTLFAFDFDGTLAPIVDDPAEARMSPSTWTQLDRLARLAPVAVVSGRAREDLTARVPPAVGYLIGNHGNEGLPGGDADTRERRHICAFWESRLREDASLWRAAQGAQIENKGLTLSLHYRHCENPAWGRSLLLARATRLVPVPRIIRWHAVFNLLPPGTVTKREALEALMRHTRCERLVVFGDDVTDELAFRDAPDNWLTVRVGASMDTAARYHLESVEEMGWLVGHAVGCVHHAAQDEPEPQQGQQQRR